MNKTQCTDAAGKAYGMWYWSRPGKAFEEPKKGRVKHILEYRKYRAMAKTAPPEKNAQGNIVLRDVDALLHIGATKRPGDRYYFDFNVCSHDKGWQQYDTEQDASYFGVWVNQEKLLTVTYAEGDVTTVICETPSSYNAELLRMQEFYGDPPPALITIGAEGVTKYYDKRPQPIEVA